MIWWVPIPPGTWVICSEVVPSGFSCWVKTCCCCCCPLTVIVWASELGAIVTVIVLFCCPVASVSTCWVSPCWEPVSRERRILVYSDFLWIKMLTLLGSAFLEMSQFQVTSQVARLPNNCRANRTGSRLFRLGFSLWFCKYMKNSH